MLIEFRFSNFRSFRDEAVLSMVASSDNSLPESIIETDDIYKYRLLKCAAVYGANASGKSNLVKAFGFMKKFVLDSHTLRHDEEIGINSFLFDDEVSGAPSLFEVDFLLEGIRYTYGFRLTRKRVVEEWLYFFPKKKQSLLFERKQNDSGEYDYKFNRNDFKGDKKGFEAKTKQNSLFISVAAQFNHQLSMHISDFFKSVILSDLNDLASIKFYSNFISADILNDERVKSIVLSLLNSFGIGIKDIEITKKGIAPHATKWIEDNSNDSKPFHVAESANEYIYEYDAFFLHEPKNQEKGKTNKNKIRRDDESEGTQKLYALLSPIFLGLENNGLCIIDELDTKLHPLLCENLIKLFNIGNVAKAQFIFTTHNTDILRPDLLRRDQIWFTEKDPETESSTLFSLADFKNIRKAENYRSNYLHGRYGAIPIIDRFAYEKIKKAP